MCNFKDLTKKYIYHNWANQYIINEVPSNISMHCKIIKCTFNNVMTFLTLLPIVMSQWAME